MRWKYKETQQQQHNDVASGEMKTTLHQTPNNLNNSNKQKKKPTTKQPRIPNTKTNDRLFYESDKKKY